MMDEIPSDLDEKAHELAKLYGPFESRKAAILASLLSERDRAKAKQRELDARIAEETVKPIMAGDFGLVHVAEIGRQIAGAIRNSNG